MNSFLNQRIVIKNNKKFNGCNCIITNENKLKFTTDIQLDKFNFLSIDKSQIDYIKQFKGTLTQYQTKEGKIITKTKLDNENGLLLIVGQFDIYEKIYIK